MGWWGFNVMEGDPPLDCKHVIEVALLGHPAGTVEDTDEAYLRDLETARLMLKHPANVEKALRTPLQDKNVEPEVYIQVLGHMVMEAGGPISSFKDLLLGACEGDLLALEYPERKVAIEAFANQVRNYVDGTPCLFPDRGLFATIQTHIDSGKGGLVNKA